MELTINVDATDKTAAVVNSAEDLTAVSEVEGLTLNDVAQVVISFVDSAGEVAAEATDADVSVEIGLGESDAYGNELYASSSASTTVGNTRVMTLDLTDEDLPAVLEQKISSLRQKPVPARAYFTLQVRTTNSSTGVVKTMAQQRVSILSRIL